MELDHKLSKLVKEIEFHDHFYWGDNKPKISDTQYDMLKRQLQELDPDHYLLVKQHTPKVSSTGKIKHIQKFYGLDKVYNYYELISWVTKISRDKNEIFFIMPKYDGCSVEIYKNVMTTKGDGDYGDNVSQKLKYVNIKSLRNSNYLRGELIISKNVFKNVSYFSQYKNIRNAVGGILNKNSELPIGKLLNVMDFEYMIEQKSFHELCSSEQNFQDLGKRFQNLDYPIDGIVIKIADTEYAKLLDKNAKLVYNSAVAFKFQNPGAWSKLISVSLSCGKHRITPIANIEPVDISGVTVNNVNLHNIKNIIDMDIHIGDYIYVERAGDVIPDITSIKPGERRIDIDLSTCPSCKSNTYYVEPFLYCKNTNCPGRRLQNLYDAVRRLNINECGKPTIEKMILILDIRDIYDILNLQYSDIIRIPGFAQKSAKNLYNEIQRAKSEIDEIKFLACLNIHDFGYDLAMLVLKHISFDDLLNLNISENDLIDIQGMGPTRSKVLLEGLRNNQELIIKLKNSIPNIIPYNKNIDSVNTESNSITVCMTGKFPEKKSYYEKEYPSVNFIKKVTKNLTYLIISDQDKNSNKQKQAIKYGITCLSISEFQNTIG